MYGLARDLKEALLGRQPKVLLCLPPSSSFIFSFLVYFWIFFPFWVFACLYMFSLKGNVESKGERYFESIGSSNK